jgi:hypothetical protein
MDASRKATREDNEITLQYKSPQETLLVEEANEEAVAKLQEFIVGLKQTPPGAAELERRVKLFGECQRIDGETSGDFFVRLRHWLDRDIPHTKVPLHAPRQTSE